MPFRYRHVQYKDMSFPRHRQMALAFLLKQVLLIAW